MTKREARAMIIEFLALDNANILMDIGSGTGSVSVQAAKQYKNLNVIAIENISERLELTRQNAEKHGVKLELHNFQAPSEDFVISHPELINKIDRVFIGGSGGRISDIIKWLIPLTTNDAIFVLSAITLETVNEAITEFSGPLFTQLDATLISPSRLKKLGQYHYFSPENPIYILTARKK